MATNEQQTVGSISTDFSWSADYAKVKYSSSEFAQFPMDLPYDVQKVLKGILEVQVKHDVCASAFGDLKMKDHEFLTFMVPTVERTRGLVRDFKAIPKDSLTTESKQVLSQIQMRLKHLAGTIKYFELNELKVEDIDNISRSIGKEINV